MQCDNIFLLSIHRTFQCICVWCIYNVKKKKENIRMQQDLNYRDFQVYNKYLTLLLPHTLHLLWPAFSCSTQHNKIGKLLSNMTFLKCVDNEFCCGTKAYNWFHFLEMSLFIMPYETSGPFVCLSGNFVQSYSWRESKEPVRDGLSKPNQLY